MQGVNKAIVLGHLGRDPEIRTTESGTKIATMSIATTESWRDKNTGERRERTEWHRIVVFAEGIVGVIEKYLKKGSKIYVEGQMATRKWTDKNNVERYTTEVILRPFHSHLLLLDSKGNGGPPPADSDDAYGTTKTKASAPNEDAAPNDLPEVTAPLQAEPDDDEIPF